MQHLLRCIHHDYTSLLLSVKASAKLRIRREKSADRAGQYQPTRPVMQSRINWWWGLVKMSLVGPTSIRSIPQNVICQISLNGKRRERHRRRCRPMACGGRSAAVAGWGNSFAAKNTPTAITIDAVETETKTTDHPRAEPVLSGPRLPAPGRLCLPSGLFQSRPR